MDEDERLKLAHQMREQLWGSNYSANNTPLRGSDFGAEYQAMLHRYAYGEAWTRPGLELKVRRLTTLAMLMAQGNVNQLRAHTRGALLADVKPEELTELLIQALVYCGAPAASNAFSVVRKVVEELEVEARERRDPG